MPYNKHMELIHALRVKQSTTPQTFAFTGAGGKTTAIFQLAREMIRNGYPVVIVTATTHLGAWQTSLADHHLVATELSRLEEIQLRGVILITGEIENDRTQPTDQATLYWLREFSKTHTLPLLIEADGSRQKSLKAPAAHEPPIPEFVDVVITVAGLSALGKLLADEYVHRAEIFSRLSDLQINQPITTDAVTRMLTHPQGGLKNIPSTARRVVLLNQADTPELQSVGGGMARELLDHFDSVIVGTVSGQMLQTFEHTAGIILAAGESTRYGAPKQLLDWKGKPFVRHIAETALHAGLWPVVVVTGAYAADVESSLRDLPVNIVCNPEYQQGQSTSIRTGIQALQSPPPYLGVSSKSAKDNSQSQGIPGEFGRGWAGAAIFLLADQPQIPEEIIRALIESHINKMQPILAPLVLEERRANPVLFDRVTFPDLLKLKGDIGGRAIFSNYKVEYISWHDDRLLLDVDKPEDYQRLIEDETY